VDNIRLIRLFVVCAVIGAGVTTGIVATIAWIILIRYWLTPAAKATAMWM
jgi:hypothetical protein